MAGEERTTKTRDAEGDPQTLVGYNVAILATDGVEEAELTQPAKALGTAGAKVDVIAPKTGRIQAFNSMRPGDQVPVVLAIENANPENYDALLLPGGALNADKMRAVPQVIAFIKAMAQAGKPMAVICHAPWELINANLVRGRTLTSYHTIQADLKNAGANWVDQEVVVDGNLVTSRQPSDIPAFNREMLRIFAQSRQANQQDLAPPAERPSINANRTAPYPDPLVNQAARNTYGATESQVNRDDNVIAPTFSDTEPGAGLNYGAGGDPDAPNLGGLDDQTTLGPEQVRPPNRRLVRDGEFESRDVTPTGVDASEPVLGAQPSSAQANPPNQSTLTP